VRNVIHNIFLSQFIKIMVTHDCNGGDNYYSVHSFSDCNIMVRNQQRNEKALAVLSINKTCA